MEPWVSDSVSSVRQKLGRRARVICILGGTAFKEAENEELVRLMAQELGARFGERGAIFLTGGMKGVQEVFARHCGDGSCVHNLVPEGESSAFDVGKDIQAGKDLEQRKLIFGCVGDVYVTVEGGPGVAMEARTAFERGAAVLPLIRTGGASAGMFSFPPAALQKPPFATEEQWSELSDPTVPVTSTIVTLGRIMEKVLEDLRPFDERRVTTNSTFEIASDAPPELQAYAQTSSVRDTKWGKPFVLTIVLLFIVAVLVAVALVVTRRRSA